MEVVVKGAEDLGVLSRRLKSVATGDKALQKELSKGIRIATKDTKTAIKASALAKLPKRGGLAALVANSRMTTKTRTSIKSPGVRILAVSAHSIRGMDLGKLRHRVFGGNRWVSQAVPPGWFSDPIKAEQPKVQKELSKVVTDISARFDRK